MRHQQNENIGFFYEVRAGSSDEMHTVYRFAGTELGWQRANAYAAAYNNSLREAMDVPEVDLELEYPDRHSRPDEYERALPVQQYRENTAIVVTRTGVAMIGDNDPMPTDYPHDF